MYFLGIKRVSREKKAHRALPFFEAKKYRIRTKTAQKHIKKGK